MPNINGPLACDDAGIIRAANTVVSVVPVETGNSQFTELEPPQPTQTLTPVVPSTNPYVDAISNAVNAIQPDGRKIDSSGAK